jgi:hypothetical protein
MEGTVVDVQGGPVEDVGTHDVDGHVALSAPSGVSDRDGRFQVLMRPNSRLIRTHSGGRMTRRHAPRR